MLASDDCKLMLSDLKSTPVGKKKKLSKEMTDWVIKRGMKERRRGHAQQVYYWWQTDEGNGIFERDRSDDWNRMMCFCAQPGKVT